MLKKKGGALKGKTEVEGRKKKKREREGLAVFSVFCSLRRYNFFLLLV
jgi:hypothetical protein